MSQLSREAFINEIEPIHRAGNVPNDEVLAQVSRVSILIINGITGAGKGHVQRKLITPTPGRLTVPRVTSDTTRDPQFRDEKQEEHGVEYWFRGGELKAVVADVKDGEYVQFDIVEANEKNLYGSRASSYPDAGPAVIDVVPSSLEAMRALPFEAIHNVALVPRNMEVWLPRLDGRGVLSPEERAGRFVESQSNLETTLADERITFVINDQIDRTVADVLQVIEGTYSLERQEEAREVGRIMLAGIAERNAESFV